MPRNAALDRLRILLSVLVILHHAAIVYGGAGGWYWREEPDGSNSLLILFNAVNQSFFMGAFFLLAGYNTPPSYERKGVQRFLDERLLRLAMPLIAYFFVLSPLTIALTRTSEGEPFWSGWWLMTRLMKFEPGPMWFSEALLLFTLGYVAWRMWRAAPSVSLERVPGFRALLLAAFAVGVTSFLVRQVVPVGESIAWLQLGYFPGYILLFVVGCMAARGQLLERVTFANARPWAIVSIVMLLLVPVVIRTRGNYGEFTGGWGWNAAFYAIWDPLIAWGILLTLLWFLAAFCAKENRFVAWLARRTYAAFIVHPPVLVALSLLAREWTAPPLAKFAVVGFAACAGSFATAACVLLIPGTRRIV
jgi:glucans biosynthesis protein C